MTENDVLIKLGEITMRDPKEIQMEMSLPDDLGIDSLGIAGLISKFEETVTAHPSMDEYVKILSNARTVKEFSDLIVNQQHKQTI